MGKGYALELVYSFMVSDTPRASAQNGIPGVEGVCPQLFTIPALGGGWKG